MAAASIAEKILRKAREKGLVEDGAKLAETEIFNLIFEPGFSTADKITDVSGRGVGMDVVRRQMQKLRGTNRNQSQPARARHCDQAAVDAGHYRRTGGGGRERSGTSCRFSRSTRCCSRAAETHFHGGGREEMVLVRGNAAAGGPPASAFRREAANPRNLSKAC